MKPGIKKALNVVSYILIGIIFVIALFMVITTLSSGKQERGHSLNVPKLFGTYLLDIQTESMVGEGGFDPGALVFAKEYKKGDEIKVGDIIAFESEIEINKKKETVIIVHKVIEIHKDHWGDDQYTTHGINNDVSVNELVSQSIIYGVYTGHVGNLGAVLRFMRSPLGFGLIVVLPVFAFFVYRVIKLILVIRSIRGEKLDAEREMSKGQLEKLQQELEALKAKIMDAPKEPEPKSTE